MKPLRLTFAGIKSYRRQQVIHWDGHTLVGITGPTGAGKSTILDAIFFALYGACISASGPKALIADGSDGTLRVEYDFQVRDKKFSVARSISRGSASAVNRLRELDGGRVWAGKREVDRRIQELLGLDKDTFVRSVILPQGRFERLLHTPSSERAGTLKTLLGLDQLEVIHNRARDRYDRLLPLLSELIQRRASLMTEPRTAAETAKREHAAARSRLKKLRAAAAELEALHQERMVIEGQVETVRDQLEHLRNATGPEPASRLRQLAELAEQIAAQEKAAAAEAIPLRERLDGLMAELGDRRPGGSLADAASTSVGLLEGLRDQLVREGELTEQIAAEAQDIVEVARLTELASQDAQRHAQMARETQSDIEAARKREGAAGAHLQRCEKVLGRVRELAAQFKHLTTDSEEKEHDHTEAEDVLGRAHDAAEQAERELKEATRELDARKRMHAAAHAAEGLHAGDDCPVCTHPLPPDFHPPQTPELQTAERLQKAATRKVTAAQSAITRAASDEAATAVRLSHARAALSSNSEQREAALADLTALLGVVDLACDDATILRGPIAAVDEARSNTADVLRQASELQATAAGAEAEAKAKAGELIRRQEALTRQRKAVAKVQDAIVKRLVEVPEPYRPQEAALAAIDTHLGQARDEKELLSQQWRELATLQQQLGSIERELAGLAKRRQRDVLDPATRLRQAVVDIVGRHDTLARLLGEPAASTSDPLASTGEQATWAEDVARSARRLLDKAPHHLDEFAELLQRCDEKASEVLHAAPTDGADLDEAIETVTGKVAIAAQKHDEATAQIAEAADLDHRIGGARPHVEALGELISLLKDGKFVAAVVGERQQSLLGIATGLLRTMTLGRFSFGPEFQIYDAHTGSLRDVRTLSGGESFQASLALALAVVEQASSTGGRADALFLDEGFGTLDQDSLAYALDALTAQVSAGRLVVIISHMRAVAQQMPALLKAQKSPAGSSIRWATDDERADPADDSYLGGLQE